MAHIKLCEICEMPVKDIPKRKTYREKELVDNYLLPFGYPFKSNHNEEEPIEQDGIELKIKGDICHVCKEKLLKLFNKFKRVRRKEVEKLKWDNLKI